MTTENGGASDVVIPAGTEKNLFGNTRAFAADAPAANATAPDSSKTGQTTQADAAGADAKVTFAELAEKKGWKSADDMAASYQNLEKSHTKKSMDLSELMQAKTEGLKPSVDAQDKARQGLEDKGYSPDEAIAIVRKLIQDEVAPVKEHLAIRETFKNQDDMQYAPQVAELVRKNPQIPWDVALRAVKYDDVAAKAEAGATQKKTETDAAKIAAIAGSSGGRIGKEVNLNQLVTDKNVPFKEVQKMMKEHFSQ